MSTENQTESPPASDLAGGSIKKLLDGRPFKASRVYFAAAIAAEKALPEHSRALIDKHDELHSTWREAGWPTEPTEPIPAALVAAQDAVAADSLANFAMELRRRGNDVSHQEYLRERAGKCGMENALSTDVKCWNCEQALSELPSSTCSDADVLKERREALKFAQKWLWENPGRRTVGRQ